MTAKELAEKIIDALDITDKQDYNIVPYRYKAVTLVESLLAAALEEARRGPPRAGDCLMFVDDHRKELEAKFEDGFSKGRMDRGGPAYEEGKLKGREEMLIECTDRHAKRVMDRVKEEVKEAYEDAAKIAEFSHSPPCCGPTIAKDIRAKAGEVGK